ncbi:translation initiation factor eIF-2B subunit epsilon [Trypanosoma grayi]|uniref:translation initiation factor eIF-2B subunit epsilon n=1 Tax=Trypanosoma grayi TaxID=71804 RepID=UPI0004F4353E|nr:translation initiation factor eIF-2B subunit epsilon [Trypanosoma grayi]KEG08333.1 translation initiation factor eIF-2B subunit epsilon [Trypanosoma grayi]
MDLAATRRGTETGRRRHGPHFTVIIVGEVFSAPAHPLSPVAPADDLPFALLPICNTPIIDYILENLAQNGVDEVCILLNAASVQQVREHLQNNLTARGRPWLESKDMKVEIVESVRTMTQLYDATAEIVDHNLVGQNSSFLFVPIDAVAQFTNLRDLFHAHVHRTKTIKGHAATLLCTSVRASLVDTLHDVLVSNARAQAERDGSQLLEREGSIILAPAEEWRLFSASELPPHHLTMLTLQKSTGVVHGMVRLEPREEPADPTVVEFKKQQHYSVRTDLLPTGFLFCSGGALSLFTFHMADQHAFLVDLLAKQELWGNVFSVLEVTPSMGLVQPINSLRAYIQANIDVCFRRFFPLTREFPFADDRDRYAVSPQCQSVYLHQIGAKVLSNTCEPCVVVGEQVEVPPNTVVRGTVFGKGVRIGEGSVIIGCIVLEGARVGCGCVLRHSLIGRSVIVGDRAEVVNSIVGEGCVLGTIKGRNGKSCTSGSSEAVGVVVRDQAIVACAAAQTEPWLAAHNGCGRVLQERYVSNIVPTRELFVRDPIPRAASEATGDYDDDDDDEETAAKFKEAVLALVDQALKQPSRIEHCMFQMKTVRLSFERKNRDLCYVVTERLLTHVLEKHADKGDPRVVVKAAEDLFVQWCRPFYSDIVTGDDEMQAMLEATCTAIRDPSCPLHLRGPVLMECLYNGCDDDLYDERGYCIVSGQSLVEFSERMSSLARQRARDVDSDSDFDDDDDDDDADSREEGMLRVARSCEPFIAGVRAFLEEEEEEEDYE